MKTRFASLLAIGLAGGAPACSTGPKAEESRAIEAALITHRAAFQTCFERAHARAPRQPGGKMDIRFTIGGDGQVAAADVESSTLKLPGLEPCMLGTIRGIRFAAPSQGAPLAVSYPFRFAPKQAVRDESF